MTQLEYMQISNFKGVNLATLIDFLVQKVYNDFTILSDLLPRKSDIDRKIEIIQFMKKARSQFIHILGLLKWVSSVNRVNICQNISKYLDEKNENFIYTADTLHHVSKETLQQAKLLNFPLPTAIDVLLTGDFSRLPFTIKESLLEHMPIESSDKEWTSCQLDQVISSRLAKANLPSSACITFCKGSVKIRARKAFEMTLTLIGDEISIPWRLINLDLLMTDLATGDGKPLLHGLQLNYIHEIVQSRLLTEEDDRRPTFR